MWRNISQVIYVMIVNMISALLNPKHRWSDTAAFCAYLLQRSHACVHDGVRSGGQVGSKIGSPIFKIRSILLGLDASAYIYRSEQSRTSMIFVDFDYDMAKITEMADHRCKNEMFPLRGTNYLALRPAWLNKMPLVMSLRLYISKGYKLHRFQYKARLALSIIRIEMSDLHWQPCSHPWGDLYFSSAQ